VLFVLAETTFIGDLLLYIILYIYICIYMLYNAYLGESKTCDLNKKIRKDLSGILHSRLIWSGCFQTNWWNYFPDSPCMDYLPTGKVKGEKWLHSRRNVGKYSHPMEHLGWVGNMTVVNFCFAIANRRFRESIECHSKGTRWFFLVISTSSTNDFVAKSSISDWGGPGDVP